jgi:hypothetical protein
VVRQQWHPFGSVKVGRKFFRESLKTAEIIAARLLLPDWLKK